MSNFMSKFLAMGKEMWNTFYLEAETLFCIHLDQYKVISLLN